MNLNLIVALLGVAISGSALAQNAASATVTDVTAEGMPTYVAFQLSGSPCGAYLTFASSDQTANKAVYAMLLEAVASGGSVWVQYNAACTVTAVHGVQVPPPPDQNERKRRLLRRAAETVVRILVFGL